MEGERALSHRSSLYHDNSAGSLEVVRHAIVNESDLSLMKVDFRVLLPKSTQMQASDVPHTLWPIQMFWPLLVLPVSAQMSSPDRLDPPSRIKTQ